MTETKEVWRFQKQKFLTKELRDTYARGFFAGLKANGGKPVEFE